MRFLSVIILCVLSISGALASPEGTVAVSIDSYLQRLSGFGYSGAVIVSLDEKIILKKGYGYADRAAKVANAPATLFDIGSLSKNFTAAAILRLETDGRLSVSDRISKYLPQAPADKRDITLHELLTHTSGVTGPDHGYAMVDKQTALREILAAPLQFPPGTKWAYSNAGCVLLAVIIEAVTHQNIEAVTHQNYENYMQAHIFKPAGMTSTGLWGARLPKHRAASVAKGYDELGVVTGKAFVRHLERYGKWADRVHGGGPVSLAAEFAALLRRSCAELKKMFTSYRPTAPSDDYYNESYGYGFWVQTLPDGTLRYQYGGDFLGYGSHLVWLPGRKLVVVSLCNERQDLYPVQRRAGRAIPDMVRGVAVPEPPAFLRLGRRKLDRFVGTYALANGELLQIHWTDNGLAAGAIGQDTTMLLDGHSDVRAGLAEGTKGRKRSSVRFLPETTRLCNPWAGGTRRAATISTAS